MEPFSVGLDVHRRQSAFVIQDAAGHVVARGEVPTTRATLAAWRALHQLPVGTPVALETGTVAFLVARQLAALEVRPVVVDAHEGRLEAYRPMQTSDRRDAAELGEGVRRGIYRSRRDKARVPREVHSPSRPCLPIARLRGDGVFRM